MLIPLPRTKPTAADRLIHDPESPSGCGCWPCIEMETRRYSPHGWLIPVEMSGLACFLIARDYSAESTYEAVYEVHERGTAYGSSVVHEEDVEACEAVLAGFGCEVG